jgi:hypothetical protein
VSQIFALMLLVISARQTLLDLFPRPGHAYIGSAIFGIHMPVWSVLIATALLIGLAIRLAFFGGPRTSSMPAASLILRLTQALRIYVVFLCAINFVSVVVQCGIEECHTFGYRFLPS